MNKNNTKKKVYSNEPLSKIPLSVLFSITPDERANDLMREKSPTIDIFIKKFAIIKNRFTVKFLNFEVNVRQRYIKKKVSLIINNDSSFFSITKYVS